MSVEFALRYAVKTKADSHDTKCQDFICVRFKKFYVAEHEADPGFVEYGNLDFRWLREATPSEEADEPLPPGAGCECLFS